MLTCNANGCVQRRSRGSQFCISHMKRQRLHGHPWGRALQPRELNVYRRQAREFLAFHEDYKQISAATALLNEILSLGANDHSSKPIERELFRLVQGGLGGSEALEVILAVWLYSMTEPNRLPDDQRLTYALGTALLKARPLKTYVTLTAEGKRTRRYFAPSGGPRKELGEIIRSRLGLLFANATAALREEERQRRERVKTLATPFTTSLSSGSAS